MFIKFGTMKFYLVLHCVVPENIHTFPTEGIIFFQEPLTNSSGNSSQASCISILFFWSSRTPTLATLRKLWYLLLGEYRYFQELHIETNKKCLVIKIDGKVEWLVMFYSQMVISRKWTQDLQAWWTLHSPEPFVCQKMENCHAWDLCLEAILS